MLTAVIVFVVALAVVAAFLFAAVVVGIHQEPPYQELRSRAPGTVSAMVRRLLGIYVSKPADARTDEDREECLTGPSTDWWNEDGEGR